MRGILEINGKIFVENINKIRSYIGAKMKFIAVVKTNAYGLGAVKIVKLIDNFVDAYAVANVDEALEISRITQNPILILSTALQNEYESIVANNFIPVISSTTEAITYNNLAEKYNKTINVHVGIDTGMGRVGMWFENFETEIAQISQLKNLGISGLMTHYSSINSNDEYAFLQKERFENICKKYTQNNVMIHSCSSFGIDKFIGKYDTAVRVGVLPFGIANYESQYLLNQLSLQNAITLKSWISLIKTVPKNTKIGYNLTHTLYRDSKIAICAIGYGDGIPVTLSNSGRVLINGHFCPIIGRISMDQLMIDVTDIYETTNIGDEIVFFGEQNNNKISIDEYTANGNILLRETTQRLSQRIARKII